MSETWVITLKDVVMARDRSTLRLDMTEILPAGEMRDLLRKALEERDFVEDQAGRLTRQNATGEQMSVDLETLEVTTTLEVAREIKRDVRAEGWNRQDARRRAEARVRAEGVDPDRLVQQDVTEQLARGEEERLLELREVLQEVHAGALKERAGQLGQVLEVQEGKNEEGEYELVIRVEV